MKYFVKAISSFFLLGSIAYQSCSQPLNHKEVYTRQDTLRGTITPERSWWDVIHYGIDITPNFKTKTLKGVVAIKFAMDSAAGVMQLDLQEPMRIDKLEFEGEKLKFRRDGNVYFISFTPKYKLGAIRTLKVYFSGKPREAVNPPWDGGWIWTKDEQGRPWMSVACQGLGASVWYPCKDHQSDEPDSASITITVPDDLAAVANGRLTAKTKKGNNLTAWTWKVVSPINNYNIVPYIGSYAQWNDAYIGETEKNLSFDYWVLDYNLKKAKKQFERDVPRMMKAFEYWFGPYPFAKDGFKLVEAPHLGMEHQSATAYGNHYKDGYLGMDMSGTGWGLKWDYIIIHEAGHEWFGNNITTNDIADMWVHEGFTDYSEVLFVDYHYGKKAGDAYAQGIRMNIQNDRPIIGDYGVNKEGSGDMYAKGANMLHTIRQLIDNDTLFRSVLRGLNKDFYHKTVDTKEVEAYISTKAGKDFSKVFNQYLRTKNVPVLEYKLSGDTARYRWNNCIRNFDMPLRLESSGNWILPGTEWKELLMTETDKINKFRIDKNFYIRTKKL